MVSPNDQTRGTTDPGYPVYNLIYLFDYIEFVFILAGKVA